MKPETDPITDDEWLIRLVWETKVKKHGSVVAANAFDPLPHDLDGFCFYRRSCLPDPAYALLPIAEAKRSRYAIVQVPVSLLTQILGLTVRPSPIPSVPGHVVVPEINIAAYVADKARFTPIKLRLAEVASENILRLPLEPTPG